MSGSDVRLVCTRATFVPRGRGTVRWLDWERDFEVVRAFGWADPPLSRREWDRARRDGFRYAGKFVGGRLVAMAAEWRRNDDAWEVAAVGTRPEARRRGHGAAVVSFVTQHILASGCVATCTTRSDNEPMLRTARTVGFTLAGDGPVHEGGDGRG
jgi:GNAT superfamily N-acetyltransferase